MRDSYPLQFENDTPQLATAVDPLLLGQLVGELEQNGIVVLPNLIGAARLTCLKAAFEARLRRIQWNNFEGYQQTEPYRHMVEDVLTLEQGFVDLAIHPLVKGILTRYIGPNYELTEAKGWKSLPTTRDFHGWHGDAWYDQDRVKEIHKEVKLGLYLTDVHSGAFNYIRGSHRRQHPRPVKNYEVSDVPRSEITEVLAPAGTVFLFDTSGIHRQGVPLLAERLAVFYNYHDPNVPLQGEDISAYRYHPLLLNAAFLGNLSREDCRVLGFGNKTNYRLAFERSGRPPILYRAFTLWFTAGIRFGNLSERIVNRLKRIYASSALIDPKPPGKS